MKLIALSLGAFLVAQTPIRPMLDLRMGLWEVTSTTDMGGVPGVDMSKMTPQRQAQIAATMKGALAKPTVVKSCMTHHDLHRRTSLQVGVAHGGVVADRVCRNGHVDEHGTRPGDERHHQDDREVAGRRLRHGQVKSW